MFLSSAQTLTKNIPHFANGTSDFSNTGLAKLANRLGNITSSTVTVEVSQSSETSLTEKIGTLIELLKMNMNKPIYAQGNVYINDLDKVGEVIEPRISKMQANKENEAKILLRGRLK